MRVALLIAVALSLACTNDIDRAKWQQMTHEDKILYIDAMIGREKAKHAKGGGGRTYRRDAQTYVSDIDRAYAGGDRRDPAAIFAGLADR